MGKLAEHRKIVHFTNLLMTETNTAKRELLQRLLTDEMVRQPTKTAIVMGLFCGEPSFGAIEYSTICQRTCVTITIERDVRSRARNTRRILASVACHRSVISSKQRISVRAALQA